MDSACPFSSTSLYNALEFSISKREICSLVQLQSLSSTKVFVVSSSCPNAVLTMEKIIFPQLISFILINQLQKDTMSTSKSRTKYEGSLLNGKWRQGRHPWRETLKLFRVQKMPSERCPQMALSFHLCSLHSHKVFNVYPNVEELKYTTYNLHYQGICTVYRFLH